MTRNRRQERFRNEWAKMADRFQELMQRYRDRVYSFAWYSLRDAEAAADVTQEVFVKLWKNLHRMKSGSPLPWILRVTRNACCDAARKRNSYRSVVQTDEDGQLTDRARSVSPGPDRFAEANEFRERVEHGLAALGEPYRSIVILREILGYEYTEIAQSLELPLNRVKVYLHRGRRRLIKQLEGVVSR